MSNVTRLPTAATMTQALSRLVATLPALSLRDEWQVSSPLPAEYQGLLPEALRMAESSLVPVSNADFFDAIGTFLDWCDLLGLRSFPEDQQERAKLMSRLALAYYQTLSDLPPDLLVIALAKIQHEHRWRNLPLPADIRAAVAEDLENRQRIRRRLKTAIKLGRFEEPPLPADQRATPEQIAAVRARTVDAPAEQPKAHKEPPTLVYPPSDAQMRRILGDILGQEQSAQVEPKGPSGEGAKNDMVADNPENAAQGGA